MPSVPLVIPDGDASKVIRVLVTGFGPFANYEHNPSWLAVKKLHNIILEPGESDSAVEPVYFRGHRVISAADSLSSPPSRRTSPPPVQTKPIHITALEVPVKYASVLDIVPSFHSRPPVLPADDDVLQGPPPPSDGYDLILHVGAGRRGYIAVETLAHKSGYILPDADDKYAPEIDPPDDKNGETPGESEAQRFEESRMLNVGARKGKPIPRGFGSGYEQFANELYTDLDTEAIVNYLHDCGAKEVVKSMDAGRYLCDFIFYCSLAEAKRKHNRTGKVTKVLFVHCPPVGEPQTPYEVAEVLKLIIAHVVGS